MIPSYTDMFPNKSNGLYRIGWSIRIYYNSSCNMTQTIWIWIRKIISRTSLWISLVNKCWYLHLIQFCLTWPRYLLTIRDLYLSIGYIDTRNLELYINSQILSFLVVGANYQFYFPASNGNQSWPTSMVDICLNCQGYDAPYTF